jgi:hypothetical protein
MEPDPVKLIVGSIYREKRSVEYAIRMLEDELGKVDFRSPSYPFDATDYYNSEMGSPLYREFFSFKKLVSPGDLAGVKILSAEVEKKLAEQGRRKVNLDPGYMDFGKLVLASFKYKANKIYLDRGVYADPTLYFEKGTFLPHPWSFPDMRGGVYTEIFLHIRTLYKEDMKRIGGNDG